jgi:hypothetical protein
MTVFHPASGYDRVKVVSSFEELVATPFADGINALCWLRSIPDGFAEVVEVLGPREGITRLDEVQLRELPVSADGRPAVELMLQDQRLLRKHGLSPELNCIYGYPREDEPGPVRTDVYSFHADSAPVEADTWLCTYHGASSEALRNEQAQRRVDIAETRAALLEEFGAGGGEEFLQYLSEQCYDLHYAPFADAQVFSFGTGNLWRIALEWPGSRVPPCIHRAPETRPGDSPRLLLIS